MNTKTNTPIPTPSTDDSTYNAILDDVFSRCNAKSSVNLKTPNLIALYNPSSFASIDTLEKLCDKAGFSLQVAEEHQTYYVEGPPSFNPSTGEKIAGAKEEKTASPYIKVWLKAAVSKEEALAHIKASLMPSPTL